MAVTRSKLNGLIGKWVTVVKEDGTELSGILQYTRGDDVIACKTPGRKGRPPQVRIEFINDIEEGKMPAAVVQRVATKKVVAAPAPRKVSLPADVGPRANAISRAASTLPPSRGTLCELTGKPTDPTEDAALTYKGVTHFYSASGPFGPVLEALYGDLEEENEEAVRPSAAAIPKRKVGRRTR